MMSSPPVLDVSQRPSSVASGSDPLADAIALIDGIGTAVDEAAVLRLLARVKPLLGAQNAAFVSFLRGHREQESFRFLLSCDPVFCLKYQAQAWYAQDPWLVYAASHSEPACASRIPMRTRSQRQVRELAATFGFVSVYVVPAPASGPVSRLGVLVLGSRQEGYFEAHASSKLKMLARALAMELHEWWVRRIRGEIIHSRRVTDEDLSLLRFERDGLGTKEIAALLDTTAAAIDSRFQRLNAKFSTPNRKATARLATEYGLI